MQVCKQAWLLIHGCSDSRLYGLKRQASDDNSTASGRIAKTPRYKSKSEPCRAFLENYFADENGRCEKLPNPRYGREEYRLPVWMTKQYVFDAYVKDCNASKVSKSSPPLQLVFTGCL